jgi:hypothetical protein
MGCFAFGKLYIAGSRDYKESRAVVDPALVCHEGKIAG